MRLTRDGQIIRGRQPSLIKTPPAGMITYRVASPLLTHTRPATCEEVTCPQYLKGWDTIVPRGSDHESLLREIARGHAPDGIRRYPERGGPCRQGECAGGPTVTFHYPPGTVCFRASEHRVSLNRPEFYTVRAGDRRQDRGLLRRHTRPEHWVEDSQENFDAVRRQVGQA